MTYSFSLNQVFKGLIFIGVFVIAVSSMSIFERLESEGVELDRYCMDDEVPLEYYDSTFSESFGSMYRVYKAIGWGVVVCMLGLIFVEVFGYRVVFSLE